MRERTLSLLLCPVCGHEIELQEQLAGEKRISYGLLKCRCRNYPVIAGIFVFTKTLRSRYAVRLLRRKKLNEALLTMLEPRIPRPLNIIFSRLERVGFIGQILFRHRLQRLLAAVQTEPFCLLVDSQNWGGWGEYLKFRYSSPSFIAAIPLISIIEQLVSSNPNFRLLDLGCGTGHLDYKLSKFLSSEGLVCADINFLNLLLAQHYFVPDAELIFLDANSQIPFKSKVFDLAFSTDTIHYLRSKKCACKELERVIRPEGTIILSHLHNRLQSNLSPGSPLAPDEYEKLFSQQIHKVLIPDDMIIESFFKNELDLTMRPDKKKLVSSKTFSLVLSHRNDIFRRYGFVERALFNPPIYLILNPLYLSSPAGAHIRLRRENIMPEHIADWKFIDSLLPRSYMLSKELFLKLRKKLNVLDAETKKLLRRFILIDAPERYCQ